MIFQILINFIIFINQIIALSFNQPRFCRDTYWDSKAITFADKSIVGEYPMSLFVTSNNSIYVSNQRTGQIHIWQDGSSTSPSKTIPGRIFNPYSIFVTTNGDIYVYNDKNAHVDKWIAQNETWISVMSVESTCFGLFIDIFDNLYCSIRDKHRVDKKWSNGTITIVAGVDVQRPSLDILNRPQGIFVDINLDLYVADSENDRIQLFRLNQRNGITVAGKKSSNITIELNYPTGIVLDGDRYLFIVDQYNNRLIASNENGFRCIFGCSGQNFKFSKLQKPWAMSFDSYGNIYVTNRNNHRVEKIIKSNICNIENLVQTNYSSKLRAYSHKCNHLSEGKSLNFYCEIIEIHTIAEGSYMITSDSRSDILAFVYENDDFTLFDLNLNAIVSDDNSHNNKQFRIIFYRKMNTSFILIVTTNSHREQAAFSITVHGPNSVSMQRKNDTKTFVESIYSSELNNKSPKQGHENCRQLQYYYEAIKIKVNTSDYYTLSCISTLDTFGYLYKYPFDPYNSVNKPLIKNDDYLYEDENFVINFYLHFNITYVLMVTTSYESQINLQGPFSVIVKGPDKVDMKQIDIYPTANFPTLYASKLTRTISRDDSIYCGLSYGYTHYEPININVIQSGNYTFSSMSQMNLYGYIYRKHFNIYTLFERLRSYNEKECPYKQFKIIAELQSNVTYVLIVATRDSYTASYFSILTYGPNNITFNSISLQTTYTSELTEESQIYPRICGKGNYYYETIQVNVEQAGSYTFDTNSTIELYGYIYENEFDPSYPNKNLITQSNFGCGKFHFQLGSYLEVNTVYILVVTTFDPNVKGSFTLNVTAPYNVTLNRINKKHDSCVVGDQCSLYTKSIGLTINDILRHQIQSNESFNNQSILVQAAAGITMIMFLIGFISGILSLITFKNTELRKVGCVLYLLASSITSLLTITIFTIKFWLVVLIQLYSIVNTSILQIDCVFIGPILKLCLYLDGWLNACVAIERTVNVSKGIKFNKTKSKRLARWTILILFILIMGSIVHEPIHHELFEYTNPKSKSLSNNSPVNISMKNYTNSEYEIEYNILCVIRYSRSVEIYNTITLFIHLLVPFTVNLFSALFIIFGSARQRTTVKKNQTFKEHVFTQMSEHKQLLISPFILLILAMPRLIISLISGCVDPSQNPWLYLCAYFISFTPPMLIFVVFVLPSELYRKNFKDSIAQCRRQNPQ